MRRSSIAAVPRAAAAFTLLEVVIVLSLLVLLSALIWPALDKWMRSSELPESADNVRATLRMAKASAGLAGRRFRIRFERGVQQPHIEYEVDPMNQPDHWEACKEKWS